jgi:hypothetical protein
MYTLWSHGELLGESRLDYVRVISDVRMGELQLTTRGLTLLDRLAQTHADAYYSARRLNSDPANESDAMNRTPKASPQILPPSGISTRASRWSYGHRTDA